MSGVARRTREDTAVKRQNRFRAVLAVVGLMTLSRTALAAPVLNPANGHYYDAVTSNINWYNASAQAEAMWFTDAEGNVYRGHLATVTSREENEFIRATFSYAARSSGYWLGGYQVAEKDSPSDGWQWVTGEPFTYANWAPKEPNDAAGAEDGIHLTNGDGQWNDLMRTSRVLGYVVEYEMENSAPVADAGGPYELMENGVFVEVEPTTLNTRSKGRWVTAYLTPVPELLVEVLLDGSNSGDPDGDGLAYFWTILSSSGECVATLDGQQPTVELAAGIYLVELIVSDGLLESEPAHSSVTIEPLDLTFVDPSSVTLCGPAADLPAYGELADMVTADTLMIKFSRSALIETLFRGNENVVCVGGALRGEAVIDVK
jgi:hypothetical protein